MLKKITLIFLLFCLISSCGKKGDPEYKSSEKKAVSINEIVLKA